MRELEELNQEIRRCTRCRLAQGRHLAVPGEGPEHPKIMFIGEAPGFHEDQQGRPFVGAAGQFLEQLLASINLTRPPGVEVSSISPCFIPPRRCTNLGSAA